MKIKLSFVSQMRKLRNQESEFTATKKENDDLKAILASTRQDLEAAQKSEKEADEKAKNYENECAQLKIQVRKNYFKF